MTIVRDKVLYSEQEFGLLDGRAPSEPTHFFEHYFKTVREKLGDEVEGKETALLVNVAIDMQMKWNVPLYGESRMLMKELEAKSRRAAAFLKSLGFREGQTLHMAVPTVADFYVPVIGAFLNNGIVSAGDPHASVENLCNQVKDTQAKVVVCCQHNKANIIEAVTEANVEHKVSVIVMRERGSNADLSDVPQHIFNYDDLLHNKEEDVEVKPPANLELPAVIFWSSGTTGSPKGIVHCWNYFWKFFQSKGSTILDTDFNVLSTLCQFHLGGFVNPLVKVKKSKTLYVLDADGLGENTKALFEAINHYHADTVIIGSHHCVRMAFYPQSDIDPNWDFSSVLTVAPTGSNIPLDTSDHLQRKFTNMNKLANVYGSTELGNFITYSTTQSMLGPIYNGAEVRIEDPETHELLGPHQAGEMVVKSSRAMLGYLNNPDENKKVLMKDGFIRTGDLACYDEHGNLYFKSRSKDLIKVMNHHIQPIEIERMLEQHPDVIEVGVFSISDPFYQEAITALVVVNTGSKVSPDELQKWADERLEKYQQIKGGIRFTKDLPRGRTGKLLRRELVNMWSQLGN